MKKYLLSIFTLGLFGIFIGYQKVQSIEDNQIRDTPPSALVIDEQNPKSESSTTPITESEPNPIVVINNPKTTTPIPTPKPKPVDNPPPIILDPAPIVSKYKDGTYTGIRANAYYGYIQVEAVIKDGQIIDVIFLEHPSDQSESRRINSRAMPILKSEAIASQGANVAIVSRATDSSMAFRQSMAAALSRALN